LRANNNKKVRESRYVLDVPVSKVSNLCGDLVDEEATETDDHQVDDLFQLVAIPRTQKRKCMICRRSDVVIV
jgi:hypothetical protein